MTDVAPDRPLPTEDTPPPEGFTLMEPFGPFHRLTGPMFQRSTDHGVVVGMWVQEKHRNAGTVMHGGMLSMLLDTGFTLACVLHRSEGKASVTTNLSINMIGAVFPGDWVEVAVDITRMGRSVVFLKAVATARGQCVADAIAQFQVVDRSRFAKG